MSTIEKVEGGCLCGTIRFTITLPTLFCGHCHCRMCRRNHGAAYVTWLAVPRSQLSIDSGLDHLTRYQSSSHGSRSFCGRCGSSLFRASWTVVGDDLPRLGGTSGLEPTSEKRT